MKNPENKYSTERTKTDLDSLELKANLNPQQRKHLEVLKDKMKKILSGKTKQELAKAGNLAALKKYKAILGEILEFLRTKKMKTGKGLSFKTMEELESVYSPEQIAHNKDEVNEITKIFVGELYPGIFNELPKDVEHIYTSFPEGRIMQKEITIGGKTAEELKIELMGNGYIISDRAEKMMDNEKSKPLKKKEKLDLVILSAADLGFPFGGTRPEIYERAQKMGLKLVPAETGPQLRLQYEDQPMGGPLLIGSEPLAVSDNNLDVFLVHHHSNGRELDYSSRNIGYLWNDKCQWVFTRE